ncbi:MAG: ATP-binding protein [Boseongicola sp. SB0673_bin_14]|nr:ATP-binding protein [Boseongicola sp. SB0667_bin_21]MYI69181.1 ATP-binding protein [Boseongicola sp. SB0673_bin_14]
MASRLHLPSLAVEGFRGIRDLALPDLGRVTLLSGKNGVGKTTVLEAVRVFASRGDSRILHDLLGNREEFVLGEDEDGDAVSFPDFGSLFHDHEPGNVIDAPSTIRIAARPAPHNLSLKLVEADARPDQLSEDLVLNALRVSAGRHSRVIPVDWIRHSQSRVRAYRWMKMVRPRKPEAWPDPIPLESLGPGLLDNEEVSRLWDDVALTPSEEFVTEALRLVAGGELQRIAVVGDGSGSYRSQGRRTVARLDSSSTPIPLKRLGDGAQRLLGLSLTLANCQDGILVIDEVENGIHHSVLRNLWRLIFHAAEEGNVQVFAATHSWDCIAGFAMAAIETPAVGTLYRLERVQDDLHAVRYSEEDLEVAAQQRIEVR